MDKEGEAIAEKNEQKIENENDNDNETKSEFKNRFWKNNVD